MKLIVNPEAANGAVGKNWPRIRDFLQAEGDSFDAVLTDEPGHATVLARQALDDGYRTIVAVGGDGTINEVINGLVVEGAVDPEVTLGMIPWGTGADFTRTLGIPRLHTCDLQLGAIEERILVGRNAIPTYVGSKPYRSFTGTGPQGPVPNNQKVEP